MNSLSGDKLSFNFEFDNYEDDDLDSEVFEGEECLPHRVTHTRGSCPSNIEREQEWFLKVRLPEALDDLKDLLEISLGCCGVSAGSSRNILTPSTRGNGCLGGTISFNGTGIDYMDMQFYSKQYLNGAKIPLKIDGTPAYELTEMKFASSCVNKCTRASVDILSGRISGKRHLTEQLNIIITNLRLATSILRLKDNDLDDFKAFEDQSCPIVGIQGDLRVIVYINELGQIVVKATALQLPGQEHSRAGQKKSLPGKTKPTKVTQVAGQGAVVLAEDKLSFDCQRLTSFFSALRVAEAHAQNFLNKLLLLYDI